MATGGSLSPTIGITLFFLFKFIPVATRQGKCSGGALMTYLGLGNGWFIVMLVSNVLFILGIWIISAGRDKIYQAEGGLVTDGIYRNVRHPQYTGIFIITLAFMIQWPTLATLILWPFVIVMYVRLAKREEQEVLKKFPVEYSEYMKQTPMFFPRMKKR